MRRRDFVLGTVGALVYPSFVAAESRSTVPKIGFLYFAPEDVVKSRRDWLLDGLSREGLHEPDQVILVTRTTLGDEAKSVPLLKELITEGIDVLITTGFSNLRAALASAIPTVTVALDGDPIEAGWIKSYAHAGGNVTGVFADFPEFSSKWLELLKEAIPNCANVIALWDPATSIVQPRAITDAALSVGVKTEVIEIKSFADLEGAVEAASARRPDGLLILSSPIVSVGSKQLGELCLKHRLPAVSHFANFARAGGSSLTGRMWRMFTGRWQQWP
jgi:putative ABC transport system substrate-binding protein